MPFDALRQILPGLCEPDVESALCTNVTLRQTLIVAAFIWPTFHVVDDLVIFHSSLDSYPHWRDKVEKDPTGVECVLNHRHLLDLFQQDASISNAQVRALGEFLKQTWSAKLLVEFPTRSFVVDFPDEFDIAVNNPSISFWQKREGSTRT